MEKDITILKLIESLKLIINFSLLKVVDYWEADLCAIGLMKGNKLVYISTFNYAQNEDLMYDFDLETIDEDDKEEFNVVRVGRNVSEAELVSEIKLFLDV
ncbi:hypothetical protein [Gynurincola endophyticus]|uniref:hypothetical protein n=1 Tax=Gynurincola endophyticus TaxID=2479004 RepID=UPI000F8C582F|nr:hypothetical protein [Gynurincola endophyticus]